MNSWLLKGRFMMSVFAGVRQSRIILLVSGLLMLETLAGGTGMASSMLNDIVLCDARKIKEPPVIDGKLDEPCYQDKSLLWGFVDENKPEPVPARKQTRGWVAYDSEHLYIGLRLDEPEMDKVKGLCLDHNGPIWWDDGVEVYIEPGSSHQRAYVYAVNVAGTTRESYGEMTPTGWTLDTSWGLESRWQSALHRGKDFWSIEMRIPFADMAVGMPKAGDIWCLQVRRFVYAGEKEYSQWSLGGDCSHPELFGHLCFEGHMGAVEDMVCRTLAPVVGTRVRVAGAQGEITYTDYPALISNARDEVKSLLEETDDRIGHAASGLDPAMLKAFQERLNRLHEVLSPGGQGNDAGLLPALRKAGEECRDLYWKIRTEELAASFK